MDVPLWVVSFLVIGAAPACTRSKESGHAATSTERQAAPALGGADGWPEADDIAFDGTASGIATADGVCIGAAYGVIPDLDGDGVRDLALVLGSSSGLEGRPQQLRLVSTGSDRELRSYELLGLHSWAAGQLGFSMDCAAVGDGCVGVLGLGMSASAPSSRVRFLSLRDTAVTREVELVGVGLVLSDTWPAMHLVADQDHDGLPEPFLLGHPGCGPGQPSGLWHCRTATGSCKCMEFATAGLGVTVGVPDFDGDGCEDVAAAASVPGKSGGVASAWVVAAFSGKNGRRVWERTSASLELRHVTAIAAYEDVRTGEAGLVVAGSTGIADPPVVLRLAEANGETLLRTRLLDQRGITIIGLAVLPPTAGSFRSPDSAVGWYSRPTVEADRVGEELHAVAFSLDSGNAHWMRSEGVPARLLGSLFANVLLVGDVDRDGVADVAGPCAAQPTGEPLRCGVCLVSGQNGATLRWWSLAQ